MKHPIGLILLIIFAFSISPAMAEDRDNASLFENQGKNQDFQIPLASISDLFLELTQEALA